VHHKLNKEPKNASSPGFTKKSQTHVATSTVKDKSIVAPQSSVLMMLWLATVPQVLAPQVLNVSLKPC